MSEIEIMRPMKRLSKTGDEYEWPRGWYADIREVRFMNATHVGGERARDDVHNAPPDFSECIMRSKGDLGSTIRRAIMGV